MKYLMMIYSNPETWGHPIFLRVQEALAMSQAERDEMAEQLGTLLRELQDSGELVSSAALADPLTARTVRIRGGVRIATDGPYAEAKEQMAGLFVVDCATPERAEEIAARFPDARFFGVEMRPVMDLNGHEM